jgi:drug/metabolite transporter (DMT)-like permease
LITKEELNTSEWRGSAVAIVGVALLVGRDLQLSHEYFMGDVTCFASMLLSASYLVLARKNRHFPSIWLYIVPMYAVAAVFCFFASFAFEPPSAQNLTLHEIAMVVCLGLIPTIMGHSALNHSMRHFRGQVVSLSSLSQPVFAGVMAFFLMGEVPDWFFYPACLLIALGASIALRGMQPTLKQA